MCKSNPQYAEQVTSIEWPSMTSYDLAGLPSLNLGGSPQMYAPGAAGRERERERGGGGGEILYSRKFSSVKKFRQKRYRQAVR